jgi:uncharacterized protein (TIGR02117 family)
LGIVEFFVFYFIVAVIFSLIPSNSDFKNDVGEIEIFIRSNGVHTDLVLPAANEYKDWTKEIPIDNTVSKDSAMNYLSFGWGDKGFYLNTPTWSDLTFNTAFKAMFGLGTSAMHVTYYKNIRISERCKKIKIGKEQYFKLVKYIENSFTKQKTNQPLLISDCHYGDDDCFYEAEENYSLFNTCNTWTNSGLKCCGVKACLWTPFDKGILYQCSE